MKEKVIKEAIEIAETPAPTGKEALRANLVARKMQEIGLPTTKDDVGNILAKTGSGPRLAVMAHLDTVFSDKKITAKIEGDTLKGKGVIDNSLGLAGLLYLAREMKDKNYPIVFAATVGEEGVGNLKGSREIIKRENIKSAIAIEGAGIESVVIGGPGSARFLVEIKGPGGHSWQDKGRESANHEMIDILGEIKNSRFSHLNIGVVAGGDSPSAISGFSKATVELRGEDQEALEEERKRLEDIIDSFASSLEIKKTLIGSREAGKLEKNHPLIETVVAERSKLGIPSDKYSMMSTDANPALAAGIPATMIGLSSARNLHSEKEEGSVKDLDRSLLLLKNVTQSLSR